MNLPLLRTGLSRWLGIATLGLLASTAAQAQLTGPKSIPGDYASLAAAVTDLNTQGVGAGGVTFNIAAGYTETASNLLITATGTAANSIVFQKSGAGANPTITAGVGTTTSLDAIIGLVGSDYVTFDGLTLAENAANTTATTQMEFGFALFRPSATDGSQFNTIRNCVVTLNKTNVGTFGIYGAASTAASATSVAATSPAGANSNNKVNATIISNAASGIYFTASTSTTLANYDQSNEIGVLAANQVYNFGTTATGWGIGGNYQNGFKVVNNTVNNTLDYVGGTTAPVAASTVTSTLRGIYGNAAPSASIEITGNTITLASGATTSLLAGIDNGIGSTAASNTVTITGNTIQNISYATATSATVYGIQNTATAATVILSNNTITNNSVTATSGTFSALRNTAAVATLTMNNNVITNNTLTGSGEYNAMFNSGITSTAMNVIGNTFSSTAPIATTGSLYFLQSSVSNTGTVAMQNNTFGPFTKSGAGGTVYGYYNNSSPTAAQSITGNTIAGITFSGATTFYGWFINTSTSQTQTIANNTVNNITGGSSTIYGIYANYGSATSVVNNNTVTGLSGSGTVYGLYLGANLLGGNAFSNTVGNLSSSGASSTVYGLYSSATNPTIYRNKVYNLSGSVATSSVYGLYVASGTTVVLHNNLIGDLRAPAATSVNAIVGLFVNGGTNVNAYFNSIYLNATSSSATTFGTSGIYLASATSAVDLRNNIVVNKSTAAGAGAYTAALRNVAAASTGTPATNLVAATNNNLYYAGTPSASNVIYVEGTTTASNVKQSLGDYQAFMGSRESASVTEDVPFLSTTGTDATFLHINTTVPTQVEGKGVAISGITIDYDGDTRNATTPDLGADEGTFQTLDLSGPSTSYTALNNTASTANRTLTVTISDPAGVATGTNAPRLYFRKGTSGPFVFVNATSVSGSTYTFTFDNSLIGGVAANDVVQYYVASQDALGNVSTSPAGGSGVNPPGTTAPATLNQYTIVGILAGTYYVGTSTSPNPARTYPTLTAAANAYNINNLGGAVTFLLLDASYSTAETFPIVINGNPDASATNTLTIKPNTSVNAIVTGSLAAGGILKLNGADYVTIDGANTTGGTTQNLTIENSSATGSGNTVVWIAAASAADGATFNTVKNTNIRGNSATGFPQFTVFLGGGGVNVAAPTTSTPAPNSNNTISNNLIQKGYYGVFVFGPSATNMDQSNVISGNQLGQGTGNGFGQEGLRVVYQQNLLVERNEIQNLTNGTTTANLYGIFLADSKNATVNRNSVHNISYTGTSTTKVWAINTSLGAFSTAANASALLLSNNLVYNINSTATSATYNTSGINLNGGFGDRVYFNTVYLTGQLSAASGTSASAAFSNGNPSVTTISTNVDVRNNIFSIIGGTGGTTTTPLYAHYTQGAGTLFAGSTFNYNDLFVTVGATGLARIGRFNSADAADLAAWRTATGQEANSVSVNPNFVQTAAVPFDLMPTNIALNNAGVAIAGITVDYPGTTRGTIPDIGAYEFTPSTIDVAPFALLAPAATSACYGPAEPVTVTIRNAGTTTLDFAVNPTTVTVVVTLPGGGTQTLTTTVNTGTLASAATLNVTLPTTLNMTATGTYSFAVTATATGDGNTANDVLAPAPTRTVAAPVAGTLAAAGSTLCISGTSNLTLTGSANGNIQLQQSTDNVTFTDITGANAATFTTPTLTQTTYYRAIVGCNASTATSNVVTVTVNNPQVATAPSPVTICAGATATLTATAATGTTLRFYDAITGGTALTGTTTTGNTTTFVTPALTTPRQYFVEAVSSGGTESVGKTVTTNLGSAGYTLDAGLVFNVTSATQLQNVTVFPSSTTAGSLTVALVNSAGTTITTAGPFAIPAGSVSTAVPVVLPLNIALPVGTGYRLVAVGTHAELHRESGSVTFPYTSPSGNVSITGGYISGASTTYYFFYNWQLSAECVNPTRTAIQVNVNPASPTPTLTQTTQPNGTVVLTSSIATGNQFYLNGNIVTGATGQTYTVLNPSLNGSYTVVNTSASGCPSVPSAPQTVTVVLASRGALPGTSLSVFPNPTPTGLVTLELRGYTKAAELTVLNVLGQTVQTMSVAPANSSQQQVQVDLTALPSGVYTLRVASQGGIDTRRVVRQ
jgi:hypothetical protein